MGLQSAMSTALTGLTAAETQVQVIGNNLANANAIAFKASNVEFATQFFQTLSLGGSPGEGDGGTNPRQVGLGTMVAAITPNFIQGTIDVSSNPTDLAIMGDGFFIVEHGAGEKLYTRNGKTPAAVVHFPRGLRRFRQRRQSAEWPAQPATSYPALKSTTKAGTFVHEDRGKQGPFTPSQFGNALRCQFER